MKIGVVGTGYVGLVTGVCFSDMGNSVICADIDANKIETLKNGRSPIYEPGLSDLLVRNIRENRIQFTTDNRLMIESSDVIFIAVGTPSDDDGAVDLKYVDAVARDIGRYMNNYKVVINKSTVPVGTGSRVNDIITAELKSRNAQIDFEVISNPEFLKEGSAIEDFLKPDRIVIGSNSQKATDIMLDLYDPFVRNQNPILVMDRTSAELTKYAANAFLATKITFMNEIANFAEAAGADIDMVRRGIGSDARIGKQFLYPGPGYGGSCFPKDVKGLIRTARDFHSSMSILETVDSVNDRQKLVVAKKLSAALGTLQNKTIAVWGLAFKARTDDMRESPAIAIIEYLLEKGAKVRAFDPEAMENARKIFAGRIGYSPNYYDILEDADALAIVTEWPEFRRPDFNILKNNMKRPLIVDGRNLFSPELMKELGFEYHSIGRKAIGGEN